MALINNKKTHKSKNLIGKDNFLVKVDQSLIKQE